MTDRLFTAQFRSCLFVECIAFGARFVLHEDVWKRKCCSISHQMNTRRGFRDLWCTYHNNGRCWSMSSPFTMFAVPSVNCHAIVRSSSLVFLFLPLIFAPVVNL